LIIDDDISRPENDRYIKKNNWDSAENEDDSNFLRAKYIRYLNRDRPRRVAENIMNNPIDSIRRFPAIIIQRLQYPSYAMSIFRLSNLTTFPNFKIVSIASFSTIPLCIYPINESYLRLISRPSREISTRTHVTQE
jgi:hypothetical protein